MKTAWLALITLIVLSGCTQTEEKKREGSQKGMKCGADKCGAKMFDGNAALTKKKKNILTQMQEKDSRKECVIQAETTKSLYDCVRDPSTGKLSVTDPNQETPMKCGAEKCGAKM
jgi:hypothetical protein